jgi:transglutaminase-like putative cysteine protease
MHFEIEHTTEYEYSAPAMESYTELRVRPRNTLRQVVLHHETEVHPRTPLEVFTDYYGNWVEFLSVPYRHKRLIVTSRSTVQTRTFKNPLEALDLTISESVHLNLPRRRELYDFLMPSRHAPFTDEVEKLAKELLPHHTSFSEAVRGMNRFLYTQFKYEPGVTDIRTPMDQVIKSRKGVCQDFAHVMIAVLRAGGIPARYVSGYIETEADSSMSELVSDDKPAAYSPAEIVARKERDKDKEDDDKPLVGATASHAWVEVFAPTGHWVGLDPTNNIYEGEQHVQIAVGRDYADVPPLRGVFKGSQKQLLSVKVRVSRKEEAALV